MEIVVLVTLHKQVNKITVNKITVNNNKTLHHNCQEDQISLLITMRIEYFIIIQTSLVVTYSNNLVVCFSSDCEYGEIPKIIISEGITL